MHMTPQPRQDDEDAAGGDDYDNNKRHLRMSGTFKFK